MSTIYSDAEVRADVREDYAAYWTAYRPQALERSLKRALDVAVSLVALIVLAIPMLLIALAIVIDSPGAPIIRQTRVKSQGRLFGMLKFRSMRCDADDLVGDMDDQNEHEGPIFKIRNDPRRTRVGAFLRKTSLDELPNLINVLLGDMSLVGPRPPLPREVVQYDSVQMRRLAVKPGMTGLWQINGRSLLPFDEMVRLDLAYIEKWSLWSDVVILVKTVPAVVSGRGAY